MKKNIQYTASNGDNYEIWSDFEGFYHIKKYGDGSSDIIEASDLDECKHCIEQIIKEEAKVEEERKEREKEREKEWKEREKEREKKRNEIQSRIDHLKEAFEASGRKENAANSDEVETLLTLTEKKIIQQCKRPHCHGCKLGWICPKFWSE